MHPSAASLLLERQLLLQLGDRLRALREARGLTTVVMARQVGVSRNTLRAVEAGDPGPSIGTYLRVMSVLGISGELALLAGDTLHPAPPRSAAARSLRTKPVVTVHVAADEGLHRLQDLQSLALHEEAVRQVESDPKRLRRAKQTVQRWLAAGDSRSAALWRDWVKILEGGHWRKVLGRTRHAQQLRQASPLVTVLPPAVRRQVLDQVGRLRQGIVLGGEEAEPARRAA
jgi:transcriptional regulator with XRE-family HTH domain